MRIGVDLGGTKIAAVMLDDDGQQTWQRRIATPSGDYQATVAAIANLVMQAEAAAGTHAMVGVGTPGAISLATGLMKNCNSTCLNGQPLLQDLERALDRPVRLANDANCFALSEATDGAAAGAEVVFGVIVGTGTGGGVVVRGHVLTGINSIAGEWGHNPLPWPQPDELPGPACYCGKSGCIESYLSGPGFARDYAQRYGETLAAQELAERDDPRAHQAWERYEDRMARALATVINILDPDVIVLGGGMSNVARLYENVPRLWTRYVFSDAVRTKLVRAKFGDASGVRGAAWLWPRA